MWDVVVIGAGPAGSAAALGALAARPDARVLLLDRSDFPRDKACGDGVAPHAVDVLAELGVHDVTRGFSGVPRLRLGYAGTDGVVGTMSRPTYVIPRSVLDARIVCAAVGRGATLQQRRVRDIDVRADHVELDGGVRGRVVVAADGANSVARRSLGVAATPNRHVALAIRGYAPAVHGPPDEQVIAFAPKGWPAYAWSFPIGDGRANVGYGEVLSGGTHPTRQHLLTRLSELLPGADRGAVEWRAHHLPLSSGRPRQPDGRVLLAGDALSLINPLTGEGIYYAVVSGMLAGRAAVTQTQPGRGYRQALRRDLGRHLRHTTVAAALAGRRRVVEAGVVAARSDSRVFDDLVELGLGCGLLGPRVLSGLVRALPARQASRH